MMMMLLARVLCHCSFVELIQAMTHSGHNISVTAHLLLYSHLFWLLILSYAVQNKNYSRLKKPIGVLKPLISIVRYRRSQSRQLDYYVETKRIFIMFVRFKICIRYLGYVCANNFPRKMNMVSEKVIFLCFINIFCGEIILLQFKIAYLDASGREPFPISYMRVRNTFNHGKCFATAIW